MNIIQGEKSRDYIYGNIEFKNKPCYLYKLEFHPSETAMIIFKPYKLDKKQNKIYFEKYRYTTDETDVIHSLESLYELIQLLRISTHKSVEYLFDVKKNGKYYEVVNSDEICAKYGLIMNELNNIIEFLLLDKNTSKLDLF